VVRDPTGAGDAFAGGFLGHLAEAGSSGDDTLARALVHGAACASFAIEEFGVAGLADAERERVDERVRRLGKLAPA
jgi:sugar/nucleoside kinase (ribokinase family)